MNKRFIGNTSSKEVHDSTNPMSNCQISEIKEANQSEFEHLEDAIDAGYSICFYCIGRRTEG